LGLLGGVYSEARLALMTPITPLHVGSGKEAGAVDLPVQRDPMGYPVVWGSSVKGALRGFMSLGGYRDFVEKFFGPERGSPELEIGRMFVSDLRLLAISGGCGLGGCLYTSRYLLLGFRDILQLLNKLSGEESGRYREYFDNLKHVLECADGSDVVLSAEHGEGFLNLGGGIYVSKEGRALSYSVCSQLGKLFRDILAEVYDDEVAEWFSDRVVLLPDSLAAEIIGRRLVMKTTRVALDYESKRVRSGALWSEEAVPDHSLFAGMFMFRKIGERESLFEEFKRTICGDDECSFYVVIGGHETIGRGLVKFRLI